MLRNAVRPCVNSLHAPFRQSLPSHRAPLAVAARFSSTSLGEAYDEKQARKYLQFTCTYKGCTQEEESSKVVRKMISTLAYEKGVVLVRCNCDKLHLIADRLVSNT